MQPRLAHVDERRVEDPAGMDSQLATNHLVLGLGVALDIDQVHVGLNSLVNAVGEVKNTLTGRVHLRLADHVDIPTGTIIIADRLEIGGLTVRREE